MDFRQCNLKSIRVGVEKSNGCFLVEALAPLC